MAKIDPYLNILTKECRGIEIVPEFRFSTARRWRFDYAIPDLRIAIEIDGAVWRYGRHNAPAGYIADMDKLNTAASLGWLVLRFTHETKLTVKALDIVSRTIALRQGRPAPMRCVNCPHGRVMEYADGHLSTRCEHPSVPAEDTGDVKLLTVCPLMGAL